MDPSALGRYLRESREAKELRIEDAVQHLHIRRKILESFEQGNFDVADTDVRRRGLLRNYARFLDLDEETVLSYYDAAMNPDQSSKRSGWLSFGRAEASEAAPVAPRQVTDTPPSLPKVTVNMDADGVSIGDRLGFVMRNVAMLLISLAAVVVILFVSFQMLRGSSSDDTQIADAPDTATPAQSVTPMETRIATSTPVPTDATEEFDINAISGMTVAVTMEQTSWVQVWVDEQEQFARTLQAGDSFDLEATNEVRMIVANAAAPRVVYNGERLDPLGVRAQQVEVVFSGGEVDIQSQNSGIQPTPTAARPTATIDPDASPTATGIRMPTTEAPPPTTTATETPQSADARDAAPQVAAGGIQPRQPSPTPLFSSVSDALENMTQTPLGASGGSSVQGNTATSQTNVTPVTGAVGAAAETTPITNTQPMPTSTPPPPTATATTQAILPPRITSTPSSPPKQP